MVSHLPKVFISYAHSTPEHKQCITDLVRTLRAKGLTVMVDADVKTPQGPEEGWPKWMKRQIKDVDWVLIFFDEVYRRRFDGEEEPDKGLGATWEGAIITHQLYRESVKNTRFIPLIADGASTRLIPDELFGATYYRIPKQSSELATALAQTAGVEPDSSETNPNQFVSTSQPQISPTRLRHGADRLFGREQELAALDQAWNDPTKHVLTIVAFGGVGKTSLVVEWMAQRAATGWLGFDRVFDWSFYSQGTREQGAASADSFIAEALKFFGDEKLAQSAASPWDKGARLAQLVAQRRTLVVLDGLEPLQHPPGPLAGQLKDPALAVLLRGLAHHNPGLCLVTTRERVADLAPFGNTTAPEWELQHLSTPAGVELLKTLGVRGIAAEFQRLVENVAGHALTLNLLGRYLAKAHQGDIRKRDQVKFEKADAKIQGGHAFKTMAAYEKWLAAGREDGARALAVLRLLGLFDRPADAGCLAALRRKPPIAGLTEPLVGLDEDDWNLTVSSLEECGLVSVQTDKSAIDAHPLIREYFARQLRQKKPKSWRSAHRRLYEHLKDSAEYQPDTLEGLQPLYQAVAHGCQAGLYQEACDDVYYARIERGQEAYAVKKLGAFGAELGAVACFFEQPWSRPASELTEVAQAWLLSEAGFCLRALGWLTEAVEPMRAGEQMQIKQGFWKGAAINASNLSELELTLGDLPGAVRDAERSVSFADRDGGWDWRMGSRTALADALHQAGQNTDALVRFREAEAMQAKEQPQYPMLYSLQGFQYCDLLLAAAEHVAWICCLQLETNNLQLESAVNACREVEQRAAQTLKWAEQQGLLLDIALGHLTLGRTALYRAILEQFSTQNSKLRTERARAHLTAAVDGLRRASTMHHIPLGFLSLALMRFLEGDPDGARADLDEAWEMAERGPMRLHMADIHLHRARLFRDKESLAKAAELIKQCGYWRRKEELADAEAAARQW